MGFESLEEKLGWSVQYTYRIRRILGRSSGRCECSGRKEGEGGSRDGKRRYEEEEEGGELDHGERREAIVLFWLQCDGVIGPLMVKRDTSKKTIVSSSEHPTRVGHALGSNKAYSHIPAYPSSLAQAKAPLQ